jgi:methionyl-tRNA synthetase
VHGHVTSNGTKLGKTAGNAVDPVPLVERWGSDAVRYALLRHVHTFKDSDFDVERLRGAYDSELAGQFGNLAQRTLALAVRHAGGVVPPNAETTEDDAALRIAAEEARREVWRAFDAFAVHDAAAAIWRFIAEANRYVDRTRPWTLTQPARRAPHQAREDARRFATILHHLLESLRIIAVLVEPILPHAARRLRHQLGSEADAGTSDWGGLEPGARLNPDGVLFPRDSAGAARHP